jgi:hypothetical protein
VVIVSLTRGDLRGEFAMANETFALSPISARAAQPSEEDYEAIREAFMETSRGRWFLGEYARRNRNADTRLVLEAVARIEETLAAQKRPERDGRLEEALTAIRFSLEEARAAASAAIDGLAMQENLAPVRKGARVIREISWRLREIGADSRICDLIDSQVRMIEEASARLAETDPGLTLGAAFDLIEGRITALAEREQDRDERGLAADTAALMQAPSPLADVHAPGSAELTLASPSQAADDEASSDTTETVLQANEPIKAEAMASEIEMPVETASASHESAEETSEPADAFDAQDEAMLDLIAAEMAAPDSDEVYVPPEFRSFENETYENEAYGNEAGESDDGEGEAAELFEAEHPSAKQLEPIAAAPVNVAVEFSTSEEPSLGSSLLANGIVQRPRASKPGPFAAIRRMSQFEKIAFFS